MPSENVVRWQCPDPHCNWSVTASASTGGAEALRCICGIQMKKQTPIQGFRYLDFLWEETPAEEESRIEKE